MTTILSRRALLGLLSAPFLLVACATPATPTPAPPPPAVATPPPGGAPPSGLELLVSDRQQLSAYQVKVYTGAKTPVRQTIAQTGGYGLVLTLPKGYDASRATVAVTPSTWRFVVNSGAVQDTASGSSFVFAVEPSGAPQLGEVVLAVQNLRDPNGGAASYTFTLIVTP